jgi:hypothetical protein
MPNAFHGLALLLMAAVGVVFVPSGQAITVEGRRLVNLSFAFHYAMSDTAPWSCHDQNLAIHTHTPARLAR